MRVLDKKIEVNENSFQPELILTIAFPMRIVEGESESISREFVKQLDEAIEEYENNIEGLA